MQRQWTRMKQWTSFGMLVMALTVVMALTFKVMGPAVAEHDQGRGRSGLSASISTGAIWRDSTSEARQDYILGITDGLRLAVVFDRARVDRGPVMDCVQRLSGERLSHLIEGYLDGVSIGADDPTLRFYVWDALVETCFDAAARVVEAQ